MTNYPQRALISRHSPVPGPHIGSGKTPQKTERAFKGATEEDPSPRMDRSNRCHVDRMNSVTELQHIQ